MDRSHRKPAHPGSRLDLVHVSASTVRRVLAAEGLALPGNPARDPVPRRPFPDWLEWKPQRVWAYDFAHFTAARRCAIFILDLVSRNWVTTLVPVEESSVQAEVGFLAALAAEDLLAAAGAAATPALRAALACEDRDVLTDAGHQRAAAAAARRLRQRATDALAHHPRVHGHGQLGRVR